MGTLTVYYNSTSTSRYTETRSSYPTVQYNGQTYSPFNASNTTKEMACSGKRMRSNLVIGGKTIGCNGKIMRSNVKAVYNPALIGPTQPTSRRTSGCAAARVGNYALFGGDGNYYSKTEAALYIDAYNTSLTRSNAPNMTQKGYAQTTFNSSWALFAPTWYGKNSYGDPTQTSVLNAYNTSLTRSDSTLGVILNRAKATIGNYALFAGGYESTNDSYGTHTYRYNTVTAYNTSLTRSTATSLSVKRGVFAGTSVGSYALFGGGNGADSVYSTTVDAYNTSLTRSTATSLSVGRYYLSAASVGSYALFGGGSQSGSGVSNYSSTVDAYNTSLTRSTASNLNTGRTQLSASSVGCYALFVAGVNYSSHPKTVDTYNTSLTHSTATDVTATGKNMPATSVGNYALFNVSGLTINAYSCV